MKIISIESEVYRIKNNDYKNLIFSILNSSREIIDKRLNDIIDNYKPILILKDSFNF